MSVSVAFRKEGIVLKAEQKSVGANCRIVLSMRCYSVVTGTTGVASDNDENTHTHSSQWQFRIGRVGR